MYQTASMEDVFAILGAYIFVLLAIVVFMIICMWKIYTKAGQPGWAVLVPFYNLYVYTQIVQRPGWWMLLYFLSIIPFVGSIAVLVISIMDTVRMAKFFGKDGGFAVGLILLGFVFYPILAFGSATYMKPQTESADLLDQ